MERIDFGEEKEDKGFCIVSIETDTTLSHKRTTSFEFFSVTPRRFVTIQLEIGENEDATECIVAACENTDLSDAVVRILYDLPAGYATPVDLQQIRQALEPAFHIAAIQPRFAPTERQRRTGVSEDLGLSDALDRYIDNNPDLQDHREELKTRALQLERECELGQANEENEQ